MNSSPMGPSLKAVGKTFHEKIAALGQSFQLEAASPFQYGFQDPATPIMQALIDLHHDIFSLLVFVLLFVVWFLLRTVYIFHHSKNPVPAKIIHGTVIEIAWTVAPTLILMLIALPSYALL